jgi:tetratricopeptide (TPR) repeat protein
MSRIGSTHSSWLYRPFLDLGPMPDGSPSCTVALEVDRRSLVEERHYPYFPQTIHHSFRDELIQDSGLAEYDVQNPLHLNSDLRTDHWRLLCEYAENFAYLRAEVQLRVVRVLTRLGLFRYVRSLVPADVYTRVDDDDHLAGMAFLRAWAGYLLQDGGLASEYDPKEFERVASAAPAGLWKIASCYSLVRTSVKEKADLLATEHWQALHEKAIREVGSALDRQDYLLAVSRFHRVGAFIPQMRRDAAETVRQMDLAEDYARQADFGEGIQRDYAEEIIQPVRQSRIKEAIWLGDLDTALARALAYRDVCRLDVYGWMFCGDVYLRRDDAENALCAYQEAVRLAPPCAGLLHFMVASRFEKLGEMGSALDHYLASLRSDHLAISSAEGALRLADRLGSPVRTWVQLHLQKLTEMRELSPIPKERAYRHFPAPSSSPEAVR